jgi:hypothetical protein
LIDAVSRGRGVTPRVATGEMQRLALVRNPGLGERRGYGSRASKPAGSRAPLPGGREPHDCARRGERAAAHRIPGASQTERAQPMLNGHPALRMNQAGRRASAQAWATQSATSSSSHCAFAARMQRCSRHHNAPGELETISQRVRQIPAGTAGTKKETQGHEHGITGYTPDWTLR